MNTALALLALFVAQAPGGGGAPAPAAQPSADEDIKTEVLTEHDAEGRVRVERSVRRLPGGKVVNHGLEVRYYITGQRESDTTYFNGVPHGPWVKWGQTGRKAAEGMYARGLKEGRELHYDAANVVYLEVTYKQGKKNGPKISRVVADKPIKEEHYVDDLLHGLATQWNQDGSLFGQKPYVMGVLEGVESVYFPGNNQKKNEITWKAGHKHGPYKEWSVQGKLLLSCTYDNDVMHGPATIWYASGRKRMAGNYVKGKYEGRWLEYADTVENPVIGEHNFRNSKLVGPRRGWYPSGKPRFACNFVNNKPHGPWVAYYESGTKQGEGTYDHGRKDGRSTYYYEDGTKQAVMEYKLDRREGLWLVWNRNGTEISRAEYRDNKRIDKPDGDELAPPEALPVDPFGGP